MSQMYAHVNVKILDKEYQVACKADERADLLDSAELLNSKMLEIRDSGKVTGLENLRPTVREPAVAHDKGMRACTKLTGDSLHPIGSTTGDQGDLIGVVDLFQHIADVVHHALKGFAHMVKAAVGEDH